VDETKVIQKLIEHDKRFDQLVTKEEFSEFRDENFNRFDDVMVILKRLDQKRVFSNERVNRIEANVEALRAETSEG